MDQNQRPHSRKKTVGTGSAGVGRGRRVSSASGPVGSGGRKTGSSSSGRAALPVFGSGKKLSLKKILIIAVIIIAIIFIFKNFGGNLSDIGGGLLGGNEGITSINNGSYSYSDDSYSSYSKPDYSVSKLARTKYYSPAKNDTATVMVYMCGTDLESKYGMATKDLQEMLAANISDNVNLIIETGGCKKWKNSAISSACNQIYKIENGKLRTLQKNAGTAAMTDPKNLTDFINYCEKNYPADRNILILWDHGGGSLTGYGYDEKKGNSSMTLSKLNSALKSAGCKFDFIGFDACLMATLENALVCSSYSDYLLASEETEPGTGWYYKNWLTELSSNTSVSTVDLSQTIIDDYISSCKASAGSSTITLSLTDLAELQGTIPESFRDFASSTNELISSDDYKKVSEARAGVRQFSQQSKINQVDLADLAQRIGTSDSKALEKALHGCVKYNQSTMSRCNGLSIYFPYESTSSVKSAVASYKDLGIDDEYAKCIKSFASLEYGGQIAASASQLPDLSSMLGGGSGDLLGSLISAYTGNAGASTAASSSAGGSLIGDLAGNLAGNLLGGGSTGSLAGNLAGNLLGGLIGGSTPAPSVSTSPLDVLLGGFTNSSTGSAAAGNSIDLGTLTSLLGAFSGKSMPQEYDWVDTELIATNAESIAKNYLDPARITATEKKGKKVLDLKDDEWGLVQSVELNVFVKDGDGYIDMGLDNTFELLDNDSLLLEYDGTWLTLNGKACAYYLVSDTQQADGSWKTVGRIPALLNDEFVNLQVIFDDDNPEGVITGAYPLYEDTAIGVQAKGGIEINAGDKLELLCDYYDLDGNYYDCYTLGDEFTVPSSGLKLTNLTLDADDISAMYRITDIYGNYFWLPVE